MELLRTQSDRRLVALIEDGSEPAFETLMGRYRAKLLRYCSTLLPPDRAEDAVQQAFLNAHTSIAAGRGGAHVRPWLYRVAHNAAIDQLRQRVGDHECIPEELPGGDRPEDAWSQREQLQVVLAAIGELPERQRDALVLRELEGRSYAEIAAALGVGDGAVRQLLNRARHNLRSAVAALLPPVLRWGTPELVGSAGGSGTAARGALAGLVAAASLGAVTAPIVSPPSPDHPRQADAERPAPARQQHAALPAGDGVVQAPAPALDSTQPEDAPSVETKPIPALDPSQARQEQRDARGDEDESNRDKRAAEPDDEAPPSDHGEDGDARVEEPEPGHAASDDEHEGEIEVDTDETHEDPPPAEPPEGE